MDDSFAHPLEQSGTSTETVESLEFLDDSISSVNSLSSESEDSSITSINYAFRKHPELKDIFQKIGYDKSRNQKHRCLGCGSEKSTNKINRLLGHATKCAKLNKNLKEKCKEIFLLCCGKDDYNLILAKIIIKHNIPLKLVDCKDFRAFIANIPNGWLPSNRQDYSSVFIPKVATSEESKFYSFLKGNQTEDYIVSLEYDHWTDSMNRSILGITATVPTGDQFLVALEDVSSEDKKAETIVICLLKCTEKIPSNKINSITSDSAPSCKLARELFVKEKGLSHILQHRCLAHYINTIGSKFTKAECVGYTMEMVNKLATFIGRSSKFCAKLDELGLRRIAKATSVRWYSNVNMLESLLNVREEAIRHFTDDTDEMVTLLNDEELWTSVSIIAAIMRPLANCIAVAERPTSGIGETMKALLEFIESIFYLDWKDDYVFAAISAVLKYFGSVKISDEELGLLLAAYFFDRRFKMDYITKDGSLLIFKQVVRIAEAMNVNQSDIDGRLYDEFWQYQKQELHFGRIQDKDTEAREWWRQQPKTGILRSIGIRIANLRSSSANLERNFSIIKLIQSPVRVRFSLDTLTHIARAKIAGKQGEYENNLLDLLEDLELESQVKHSKDKNNESSTLTECRHRKKRIETRVDCQTNDELNDNEAQLPFDLRDQYERFTKYINFKLIRQLKSFDSQECSNAGSQIEKLAERFLTDSEWELI